MITKELIIDIFRSNGYEVTNSRERVYELTGELSTSIACIYNRIDVKVVHFDIKTGIHSYLHEFSHFIMKHKSEDLINAPSKAIKQTIRAVMEIEAETLTHQIYNECRRLEIIEEWNLEYSYEVYVLDWYSNYIKNGGDKRLIDLNSIPGSKLEEAMNLLTKVPVLV